MPTAVTEPTPMADRYLRCLELSVLLFGTGRAADAVEQALARNAPAGRRSSGSSRRAQPSTTTVE